MAKKYKAVVIGCGRIGAEEQLYRKEVRPGTHAAAYSGHPQITLAGLADVDSQKLKAASRHFPGIPLFTSAEKMLKVVKPDIVSVATPVESHPRVTMLAAALFAKAVVCEKPIAPTLAQARKMIEKCRKTKTLLFINHTRRFDTLLRTIRQEIQEQNLGQIVQGTCYYYNGLFNNGTHIIDLLRFFLGEVDWVRAQENKITRNPKLKNDLNVDAQLHFKRGTVVNLQSLPANYIFSEFYFYGQKGAIFLRDMGYRAEYHPLKPHRHYQGYYQLSEKPQVRGFFRSFMKSMADHIVKCLEGKDRPVSRGEDGLSALKILFALRESARHQGKMIKIK